MSRTNCAGDDRPVGWLEAAAWERVFLIFSGSLCIAVSIWCLVKCPRTNKGVKFQLLCLFTLKMAICIIALPFYVYRYRVDRLCLESKMPEQLKFFLTDLSNLFFQAERINFMAISVYRAMAVCFPHQYLRMVRMKTVICVQVGIFLAVVPPWIIKYMLRMPNNKWAVEKTLYTKKESPFKTALYGIYYCLPFVITLVAYAIMMICIHRHNRQMKMRANQPSNNLDHVAFTIRMVLLANIILDGPHVITHFVKTEGEVGFIVVHMIFFIHILLDPFIFIVMNKHYRNEIFDKIRNCVSTCSGSPEPPSCPSLDTGEGLKDKDEDDRTREFNI